MFDFETVTNIDVFNMIIATLTMVVIGGCIFIKRRIRERKRKSKN